MTELNPQESPQLETTTPEGTPVEKRLSSATAARNVYTDLKESAQTEARRRARLQGMIDGNPPYDPKKLKEAGMAHLINVNFMSLRSQLDRRAAAAFELLTEVPTLIEVTPATTEDIPSHHTYAGVVAEEFSRTVLRWPEFTTYMDQVVRESDAYGIGYCMFPDQHAWKFKAYKRGTLLFDDKALTDINSNDVYMIRDEFQAADFMDMIEKPGAESGGWAVDVCRSYLAHVFGVGATDGDDPYQRSAYESLQQMRRNSQHEYEDKQFAQVKVVHVLTREVSSGKVTHQIIADSDFPYGEHSNDTKKRAWTEHFLFEHCDRYADMSDVLWWLPANNADGYARSVRGIASYLAQHDDLSNRFLSQAFNAGMLSGSLLMQPRAGQDLSQLRFTRVGPYTLIPPEVQIQQSSFSPQINPMLALRGVSEAVMQNNTGLNRPHNESGAKTPESARQIAERAAQEAQYDRAALSYRYSKLDFLFRQMLHRMAELPAKSGDYEGKAEAVEFRERCIARGVPEAVMDSLGATFDTKAARAIGLGSPQVRQQVTQQLLGMAHLLPEAGRANAVRDAVAAIVGQASADRYMPAANLDAIPTNETSLARLENNDLMEGSAVLVGSDQTHKLHIDEHMQVLATSSQAATTPGSDPNQVARTIQLTVAHISDHLQPLRPDPTRKAYIDQVERILKAAMATLNDLQRQIEQINREQQRQQARQQQIVAQAEGIMRDREHELKRLEIAQAYQLEAMKQASLNQMRADKTAQQLNISRGKAAADIQLKAQRQQADIALDQQKVQGELAIEAAK